MLWPADKVERWPLERLKNYARNARTHTPEQVEQVAASMREWGWTNPVLVDENGTIIAGHCRVAAAKVNGYTEAPVMIAVGWSDDQKRAYVLADNKLALNAGWDSALLVSELRALEGGDVDLGLIGFSDDDLAKMLQPITAGEGSADDIPGPAAVAVSVTGNVWICGRHRVMCGDSTELADVERLMGGRRGQLLHADPPYGMGKAAEGVANDNLYREELDRFQMAWWSSFRPFMDSDASAYIWGNAPDLWRLWYAGGLAASERFEFRNEIVWDKKAIPGMASPLLTQYPEASERCLFFQFGQQFLGNINTDDFPESWEPVRAYLEGQARAAGIQPPDVKRLCEVGMYSHWFTRAQFTLIPERHYLTLAGAYPGCFTRDWGELKAEWRGVAKAGRDVINGKLENMRSFFDNAHDTMRDVWDFPRVTGEEREGHATPKPVAMMERVMRSSCPPDGVCVEPFGGSGATLMGAEVTGRTCFTMELQALYVDVIVKRWQRFTGQAAVLESDGRTFAEVARPAAVQAGEIVHA